MIEFLASSVDFKICDFEKQIQSLFIIFISSLILNEYKYFLIFNFMMCAYQHQCLLCVYIYIFSSPKLQPQITLTPTRLANISNLSCVLSCI